MKKNQRWMLLTTALLVCIAMTGIGRATPDTIIAVDPPEVKDLEPGQTFTVDITITDVTDLYSWDINMTFEPTVLNVQNATEGPFLQEFYETAPLPVRIDNDVGTVIIGGMFKPPWPENGANGSGVLATITFTVKGRGETQLQFQKSDAFRYKTGFPVGFPIAHTTEDGFFRNATPTILSIELIIGIVVAVTIGGSIAVFFYRRRRTISET